MCHRQTVSNLGLNYQISCLYMLKKVMDQELNLDESLIQYGPMLSVDHLTFISIFHAESLPKCLLRVTYYLYSAA